MEGWDEKREGGRRGEGEEEKGEERKRERRVAGGLDEGEETRGGWEEG